MKHRLRAAGCLLLLTVFAFVLQGYHPGAEDDGIYLSAIKKDLHPSLYPYNSGFFMLQLKASIFDTVIAATVRWTHLPIGYVCLLWQLAGIALLLAGCWRILKHCFGSLRASFAGVLTVACILTLPVAGTAIYISDEHLHPRLLATDAIVFAIAALQRRQMGRATALLLVAMLFHPIMGAFGVSFCVLYELVSRARQQSFAPVPGLLARGAAVPGSWLFARSTASAPAWHQALAQHSYLQLSSWTWYEWLGAIAPPFILYLLARQGRRRGNDAYFQLALVVALFSVVQLGIAVAMLLPPGSERFYPLQPMRYLHLTFLLMALLAGAALGEYVLRARLGRWLLVFLPLAAANGLAQRSRYPATRNLEMPWQQPDNAWLRTFAWVKQNTPEDAVFALDPHYLALPGEDNHSFRALAERSSLADDLKDSAEVAQAPEMADKWVTQCALQRSWKRWTRADFEQLARRTPVRWVVVAPAQAAGLSCPYSNEVAAVCRIP